MYPDLPAAVLAATLAAAEGERSLVTVVDPAAAASAPEAIARALALLAGAQRPLVILGKGAAYAVPIGSSRA
ncbi:MAG: hypothetical protein KIT14_12155 [bacterium]|nr:hypothetical protein [bacterium]